MVTSERSLCRCGFPAGAEAGADVVLAARRTDKLAAVAERSANSAGVLP